MAYRLGVDLGTTYTAAAVLDGDRLEMLALGNRALQVPSVVFVKPDGDLAVGEAAERRGAAEPDRLVREFKRRIGDTVPIVVAGTPYSPQSLVARLLGWVVDVATERQGGPPERITVSHPANWGPFKTDLLQQAIQLADLHDVATVTEPQAAALTYASRNRMADGETIAVYDLGGGTFDAAVLRREGDGFRILGTPEGIEHLGGVDFDEAVFRQVLDSLRGQLAGLDQDDPAVTLALARLRRDCVEAKEALSSDTEALVPVVLPGSNTSVRLTRAEFEATLAAPLAQTVSTMRRVLDSAGVEPAQLRSIVLIGGSSRIPLVSETLAGEFGRPLSLDTHPKHDVALGAALYGSGTALLALDEAAAAPPEHRTAEGGVAAAAVAAASGPPIAAPTAPIPPTAPRDDPAVSAREQPAVVSPDDQPTSPLTPAPTTPGPPPPADLASALPPESGAGGLTDLLRRRRPIVLGAAAVLVALVVGGVAIAAMNSGSPSGQPQGSGQQSTSAPPSSPASSPASSGPPAGALPDDTIAWPHARANGELAIFTASTHGGNPTRVTPWLSTITSPNISPDRTRIAYSDGNVRLMVVSATGASAPRPLVARSKLPAACAEVGRPAWSVSNVLALECFAHGGGLYLYDQSSGKATKIEGGEVGDPAFSRDGSYVAYWAKTSSGGPSGGSLYVRSTRPPFERTRLTNVADGSDADPSWSPSGVLAFRRREGSEFALYTMPVLDNGVLVGQFTPTVLYRAANAQDPTFSPDGRQVAFKRGPNDDADIWVINADGSGAKVLEGGRGQDQAPSWSTR